MKEGFITYSPVSWRPTHTHQVTPPVSYLEEACSALTSQFNSNVSRISFYTRLLFFIALLLIAIGVMIFITCTTRHPRGRISQTISTTTRRTQNAEPCQRHISKDTLARCMRPLSFRRKSAWEVHSSKGGVLYLAFCTVRGYTAVQET